MGYLGICGDIRIQPLPDIAWGSSILGTNLYLHIFEEASGKLEKRRMLALVAKDLAHKMDIALFRNYKVVNF